MWEIAHFFIRKLIIFKKESVNFLYRNLFFLDGISYLFFLYRNSFLEGKTYFIFFSLGKAHFKMVRLIIIILKLKSIFFIYTKDPDRETHHYNSDRFR